MANTKTKTEIWRLLKYIVFSSSAGLVQIGSLALLDKLLDWPYWPCYLISLALSVVWNFTLNRKFTFKSANNIPVAMLKVTGYYLVFTPLSTLLGYYLADLHMWNRLLVTAINMLLNFVTEYTFQRIVVFGKSIDTNEKADKEG